MILVQLLSAFLLLKQTHFSVIVLPAYRNNDLLIWPGGEVVTLESAKLPCAGSIPAQASRERANDFARARGLKAGARRCEAGSRNFSAEKYL